MGCKYSRPNIEQISIFNYKEKLLWARFDKLAVGNELLSLAEKSVMTSNSKIILPHLR